MFSLNFLNIFGLGFGCIFDLILLCMYGYGYYLF